jgi:hypothetical protein
MDALSSQNDPDILKQHVIPAARAMRMFQQTQLRQCDEKTILNGGSVILADYPEISPDAQHVCLIDTNADLRAIVSASGEFLRPIRVFP